jgi:hypothetical protein
MPSGPPARSFALGIAASALVALAACAPPVAEPTRDAAPSAIASSPSPATSAALGSTAPRSNAKPELVAVAPSEPDVRARLASEAARAEADGRVLLAYVGATWCEPCQRFHDALVRGELDRELAGVRFVEFDFDAHGPGLTEAGCTSRMIPLFSRVSSDGACTERRHAGAIKGDGAVGFLLPYVKELLQ